VLSGCRRSRVRSIWFCCQRLRCFSQSRSMPYGNEPEH